MMTRNRVTPIMAITAHGQGLREVGWRCRRHESFQSDEPESCRVLAKPWPHVASHELAGYKHGSPPEWTI